MTETTARDVLDFLKLADDHGVRVWLDGGWAVDACLGNATRAHPELEVVVWRRDLDMIARALLGRGYEPRPWNFALGDAAGHKVDFDVADRYPAEALTGRGKIGTRQVMCIAPEWRRVR